MHISVLLEPILQLFGQKKLYSFIDATLGAAGHTLALMGEHPELTTFIGFDRDEATLLQAKEKLPATAILIHSNFSQMQNRLLELGINQVDGILMDIGVSSMQIDQPERGFSFMHDGPLDMRMDLSQTLTAEDVVNSYPEEKLANIIYNFGEEHASRRIAKAICQMRKKTRIITTAQLANLIEQTLGRRGKIHPATRTFQALRIEVNRELRVARSGFAAVPPASCPRRHCSRHHLSQPRRSHRKKLFPLARQRAVYNPHQKTDPGNLRRE